VDARVGYSNSVPRAVIGESFSDIALGRAAGDNKGVVG
jgi:hypothetical protein